MHQHPRATDRYDVMGRWNPVPGRPLSGPWAGRLLILAIAAGTARCATTPLRPAQPPAPPSSAALRIEIAVGDERRVETILLEDYVRGSVPAEMPLGGQDAAVAERLARLQAILARTYALANRGRHAQEGFDLCSTTHCQVYRPPEQQSAAVARLVDAAVEQTRGLIITDGHVPIQALFHADCAGHTSSATAIWGGPAPPYLSGVRDSLCVTTARDDWHLDLDRDHLRRILNTAPDTAVGRRLDRVEVVARDPAGRATRVAAAGEFYRVVRGERLRSAISGQLGPRAFRSARFSVEYQAGQFLFSGQGFGHGVGLCQTGAIVRARRGDSVRAILAHYYPGTRVEPHLAPPVSRSATARVRVRHHAGITRR